MTGDGGLQDAVDAARALRDAETRWTAERTAEERAAEEGARDRLRAAGAAFVKRARAARIQLDTIQVQTGVQERGFLSRNTVPVYEDRRAWVISPDEWECGGEVRFHSPGLGVLEDGTVIRGLDPKGGVTAFEGYIRQSAPPMDAVEGVIKALAEYLVGRDA